MHFTLDRLFAPSFHVAPAHRGGEALEEARQRLVAMNQPGASAWEVAVPDHPDRSWFEGMLARLVYHCESVGASLPACGGVFVAFFARDQVHCVRAAEVVRYGCDLLGLTPGQLARLAGPAETHTTLR